MRYLFDYSDLFKDGFYLGIEVIKKEDEFVVKIEDYDVVDKVFKKVSNNNIVKFVVEEATLNEIFIEKVGELK